MAHKGACLGQVDGPVQSQHIAVQRAHFLEPLAAALGEHDAGNAHSQVFFFDLRQHAGGVGQAELLKRTIGEHATPTVKNHDRLGACFNLCVQVLRHGVGIDLQHSVHQVRAAVQHGFDQAVIVRAGALDHVARQRPGAAREADQRHAAVQGFAD